MPRGEHKQATVLYQLIYFYLFRFLFCTYFFFFFHRKKSQILIAQKINEWNTHDNIHSEPAIKFKQIKALVRTSRVKYELVYEKKFLIFRHKSLTRSLVSTKSI